MGRNYYAKRLSDYEDTAPDTEAQRIHLQRAADAREYALQAMPDVRINESEEVFCPYAACGARQASLTIGIHTCRNSKCARRFKVPDNATNRRIKRELVHDRF